MARGRSVMTAPAVHARRMARRGRGTARVRRRGLVRLEPDTTYRVLRGGCGFTSVAIDAPTHRQRCVLAYALHRFNRPVTRAALDAVEHVLAVVEVHEVGERVHLGPPDRAPLTD